MKVQNEYELECKPLKAAKPVSWEECSLFSQEVVGWKDLFTY